MYIYNREFVNKVKICGNNVEIYTRDGNIDVIEFGSDGESAEYFKWLINYVNLDGFLIFDRKV